MQCVLPNSYRKERLPAISVSCLQGTKSVVEEQRALELKWLLHRKPSVACYSLIRKAFTWDFRDRLTSHDVRVDPWLLDTEWLDPAASHRPTGSTSVRFCNDQLQSQPRSPVSGVPTEVASYAVESVSMVDADTMASGAGGDQPMESPRNNWVID